MFLCHVSSVTYQVSSVPVASSGTARLSVSSGGGVLFAGLFPFRGQRSLGGKTLLQGHAESRFAIGLSMLGLNLVQMFEKVKG